MPQAHEFVCADNVPDTEKNHPEGYVYCANCGESLTGAQDTACLASGKDWALIRHDSADDAAYQAAIHAEAAYEMHSAGLPHDITACGIPHKEK